jgi:protein O-GlcNAc transferase
MPRSAARIFLVILLLLLAIFVPFTVSGYSELRKASSSDNYMEAAQHYQNAARRLPWRADLFELSGHNYYYARDYVQADAAYQKAFARRVLSPEGWVAWGDVLYLHDDPERAAQIWEQAQSQPHPAPQLYSRLAQVYQSNGEFSRAAKALQRSVEANPADASAHYRLGLLLASSEAGSALSHLLTAAQLDPAFDPAAQTLRTALNQASISESPSARFVLTGRGLGLVNEWALARAAFEAAVEADGNNAEAWAWLGEANQQTGVPEAGMAELDRAVALDSKSAAVRGLRGLHFQRLGNFRQALVEFQMAAALEPENPAWLVSMGEALAKTGDLIRALESYQSATALAPEDPLYWRLLAIFCAQNNVNVEDVGIPAAQEAVILAGGDPDSLDVLGWLLTLDAQHAEADRMLTRALELDPGHASAHFHLGLLRLQMEDRASAYDHLIQARDLGHPEAELVLKQYFP